MYAPFLIVNSASTITPSTASMTSSPPSTHMQSSYYPLGISDQLLCELCNMQADG